MPMTFSLADLCGCPSGDCPECCGVPSPCCALKDPPRRLYLTISNLSSCSGVDGVVLQLDYDAATDTWIAPRTTSVCSGHGLMGAVLQCVGTDCTGWFLAIGSDTTDPFQWLSCSWTPTQVSCNCDPFQLVFEGPQVTPTSGGLECGCCVAGETIRMTVTE